MRIIELKPSKSGETYKVWLDCGSCVIIETETVVKFHLKDEMTFSDEQWNEVLSDNAYISARRRAFNILGYHAVSQRELFNKLTQKGADKETAEKVVDKMLELGLLNDKALLKEKVRHLAEVKKYGEKRIVSALMLKGFEKNDILSAISDLNPDEYEAVCRIIEKKYETVLKDSDLKTRQKVAAALIRRGFNYDTIKSAIQEYI